MSDQTTSGHQLPLEILFKIYDYEPDHPGWAGVSKVWWNKSLPARWSTIKPRTAAAFDRFMESIRDSRPDAQIPYPRPADFYHIRELELELDWDPDSTMERHKENWTMRPDEQKSFYQKLRDCFQSVKTLRVHSIELPTVERNDASRHIWARRCERNKEHEIFEGAPLLTLSELTLEASRTTAEDCYLLMPPFCGWPRGSIKTKKLIVRAPLKESVLLDGYEVTKHLRTVGATQSTVKLYLPSSSYESMVFSNVESEPTRLESFIKGWVNHQANELATEYEIGFELENNFDWSSTRTQITVSHLSHVQRPVQIQYING